MSDVQSLEDLKDCYVIQPNGKRALSVNSGGVPLDVYIRQAVTAFNEVATAEFRPQTGWSFAYNLNEQIISETVLNGGSVSHDNVYAKMETGTDPNGVAFIRSNRPVVYTPGRGARVVFTALFSSPVANSRQTQGVINASDGWAFGYEGETFGIIRRRATVDDFIPQSEWNIDKRPDLDPTKGNVYSIDFQWLGFGAQYFAIENDKGILSLVHIIIYANLFDHVSVENASLPLAAGVANFGNTSNIILRTPSAVGGIYGKPFEPAFEALIAYDMRDPAIAAGETYLFGLQNPDQWLGKDNRLYVLPKLFVAASEGNKPVTFRVYSNPTILNPSWVDVSPNVSPLQYDESGTFVANGEAQVFTLPVGKSDSKEIDLSIIDAEINPRQIFAITVDADSLSDVRVGITFKSRT